MNGVPAEVPLPEKNEVVQPKCDIVQEQRNELAATEPALPGTLNGNIFVALLTYLCTYTCQRSVVIKAMIM